MSDHLWDLPPEPAPRPWHDRLLVAMGGFCLMMLLVFLLAGSPWLWPLLVALCLRDES